MAVLSEEEEKEFILRQKDAHMPHMLKKFIMLMDVQKLAEGLTILPEVVVKLYKDGRVTSPLSECKACDVYGINKSSNTNSKADCYFPMESALSSNLTIGVRCLTKNGVSFTQAAFAQDKSNWKPVHVYLSQRVLNFQVVCDIVDFPTIYFTSCLPADIIYYTMIGTFKESIKRDAYYKTMFNKSLDELIKNNEFLVYNPYLKGEQ